MYLHWRGRSTIFNKALGISALGHPKPGSGPSDFVGNVSNRLCLFGNRTLDKLENFPLYVDPKLNVPLFKIIGSTKYDTVEIYTAGAIKPQITQQELYGVRQG